jgi:hypothetical protein
MVRARHDVYGAASIYREMRCQCGVTSSCPSPATGVAGLYHLQAGHLRYILAGSWLGYWLLWVDIMVRQHVPKTERSLLAVWDTHSGSATVGGVA